jgi:hypothetical protein
MHLHGARGEWPVLDDKYGTFAAKEYLHALSLGPYKQEKMVDEKGEALPPVHALAFPAERDLCSL